MDQQIFTDGIGRITVIGGVVRLDLVTEGRGNCASFSTRHFEKDTTTAGSADVVSLTYLVFNNRLSFSRGDFRPGYKKAETPMAISSAIEIALIAPAAIVAIPFHEAAHGYVAHYFGDDTAMLQGD
jgi:hypothetical protein